MKKLGLILAFLLIVYPCYPNARTPENQVNKIIVFDMNEDQRNELLAQKGQSITIYSFIENGDLKKTNEFSISIPIRNIFTANNEVFIFDNKALYLCEFSSDEIGLVKIANLDSMIDLIYNVYQNNNDLIVTAAKIRAYEPLKLSLVIVEIDANKNTVLKELKTVDWIHSVYTYNENGIKFAVITGIQDKLGKLMIYELKNNQLNRISTNEIPNDINTLSYVLIRNGIMNFSGWYGDIESDEAFPGIFAFDLKKQLFKTVIDTGLIANSIEINDLNKDGRNDLIWADTKNIYVESNIID